MADAVDRFFDRLEGYVPRPVYVSPMVSNLVGLVVLAIAAAFVWPIIDEDRIAHRNSGKLVYKARWVGLSIALVFACLAVHQTLSDKIYYIMVLMKNRQHFANVYFLGKYVEAFRPSTLGV